jgi:hypothetical protein
MLTADALVTPEAFATVKVPAPPTTALAEAIRKVPLFPVAPPVYPEMFIAMPANGAVTWPEVVSPL